MENYCIAKWIRNAFVLGGLIMLAFITFHFLSGNHIGERLEGTWRATNIQDEITFVGSSFTRGQETGEFHVLANFIYLCKDCNGYPIRITAHYMVLNGHLYFRTEP